MGYTKRVKIDPAGNRVTWEDSDGTATLVLWLDETDGARRASMDYFPGDAYELDDNGLEIARVVLAYLRDDAEALAEAVAIGEAWERDGTLPGEVG